MNRETVLETAKKCVCGDREQDYGNPERNFETIAELWEAYLLNKFTSRELVCIEPHDVAAMMALVKISRISSGQCKDDNWVDLAGYAACGAELQGGYNANQNKE